MNIIQESLIGENIKEDIKRLVFSSLKDITKKSIHGEYL